MPQPIFVVGRRRSGTKWLSNTLARHSCVACALGRRSGIMENSLFDRVPEVFGDLSIDANYFAFLACYSESDFARTTGTTASDLFASGLRDYLQVFGHAMDRFAEREHATHWVQKVKSHLLPQLVRTFPHAIFLIIRRDVRDNVRSSMALDMKASGRGRPPRTAVLHELASYYRHVKVEDAHLDRANVHLIRYEDLRAQQQATVRGLCSHVGLSYDPSMLETGYAPNTSFSGQVTPDQAFGRYEEWLFQTVQPLMRRAPRRVLDQLSALGRRSQPHHVPRFRQAEFRQFAREISEAKAGSHGGG